MTEATLTAGGSMALDGHAPSRPKLLATERRLGQKITGSLFKGHGSVLGLTMDRFQDEDRIKSALVQ